eukprot:TRINITY_DN46744_c0_g1_i1.p1 TRINITY_DN46744_c0_g1~~TRINITY_DN46744_c0_g1_i1.p1  ORF type:complete len:360 (+),score=110.48 TRINITY_DN46744_c0_g1_i1:75-1082(+)
MAPGPLSLVVAAGAGGGDASAAMAASAGRLRDEDVKRGDEWAEVFEAFHEKGLEDRVSEYAEAVVALWRHADSLQRQLANVQKACDVILTHATREASRAHLASLTEAARHGVPEGIQDAANRDIEAARQELEAEAAARSATNGQLAHRVGIGSAGASDPTALQLALAPPAQTPPPPLTPPPMPLPPPPPDLSALQQALGVTPSALALASGGTAKPAAPKAPGPSSQSSQSLSDSKNNLYVSGLPPNVDDVMFRKLFQSYGPILSTKVVPEKKYGFVKYALGKDAQAAIDALNNLEFNGTRLNVRPAAMDAGAAQPQIGREMGRAPVSYIEAGTVL